MAYNTGKSSPSLSRIPCNSGKGSPSFNPRNITKDVLQHGDICPNPGSTSNAVPRTCQTCSKKLVRNHRGISCCSCGHWHHIKCAGLSPKDFKLIVKNNKLISRVDLLIMPTVGAAILGPQWWKLWTVYFLGCRPTNGSWTHTQQQHWRLTRRPAYQQGCIADCSYQFNQHGWI